MLLAMVLGAVAFAGLETSASSHWVVTEQGRIQPKENTIFDMKHPDDLVGFLRLERKLHSIQNLTRLMSRKRDAGSSKAAEEPDAVVPSAECDSAIPIEDCNFYFSTTLFPNDYKSLLSEEGGELDELPVCAPQNFSVRFYEHLQAMQERSSLRMQPERGLVGAEELERLGRRLAAGLRGNATSWRLLHAAALFWRARGAAPEALDCVRLALAAAPPTLTHIPLLHLGNVFHQARRSAEAAIVLHAAIDHSGRDAASHWTLGNVYSVLGDYRRAVLCFENALRLERVATPGLERNLRAVRCHASVNDALADATTRLQQLLDDLEDANLLKQERAHIEGLVKKQRAISELALKNLGTEVGERILQLDERLKGLVDMVQSLSDSLDFEKRVLTQPDAAEGECLDAEPVDPSTLHSDFESRVESSLNEGLGLRRGENHPLPWHPPVCEAPTGAEARFEQLPSHVLQHYLAPGKSNRLRPQPELMLHLRRFVHADLRADEELGQRIHAALNMEATPRGLVLAFAGLYWQARGELREAAACLLAALRASAPGETAAVPLTALAALLARLGHSDGAVFVALKAVDAKMVDVGGNLLLAALYLARGEGRNARLHLQQAFLQRPSGRLRRAARALECRLRLAAAPAPSLCPGDQEQRISLQFMLD